MEQNGSTNVSPYTKKIVVCALLIALSVVLSGMLSVPVMPLGTYSLKIGLGMLPVLIASALFGPLYGGMVGGLADLLQALIFPKGAYMPWFTVVGTLFGVIPGLFFLKKRRVTFGRLLGAVATGQAICSVGLNTLLLVWLYGSPWQIVYTRMINQAVMILLYTVLAYAIIRLLRDKKVI